MEKNKRIFCLALAGILSLGSIMAQELQIASQEERTFSISLTDEIAIMGLQLELFLPDGMTLTSDTPVELNSNLADHTLRVLDLGGGHYIVLVYDMELKAATISKEVLLKCHFLLSPDMLPGEYPLTISGVKLAKDALHAVCPKSYEGCLCLDESGATAVRLPGQSHAAPAIYDLSGRRQAEPRRGINIIDDRKVVMK